MGALLSGLLGGVVKIFSGGWIGYALTGGVVAIAVGYGTWQITHWANAQDLADANARTAVQHNLFLTDEGTIKTLNAAIVLRNDQIARDKADANKRVADAEKAAKEAKARADVLLERANKVLNFKGGDDPDVNALEAAMQGFAQ